jgi:hypothetical protein
MSMFVRMVLLAKLPLTNRDSPAVAATCKILPVPGSRQTLISIISVWLTIEVLIEFIFESAQAGFYGKPSAGLN